MDTKEVWLAGKGPSLDTYNWNKAGSFRVGINEAAFIIPSCWGAIAIDYCVLDKYRDRPIDPSITVYRKTTHKHSNYDFSKMILWDAVENMHSTAVIAIQLLYQLNDTRIFHMVGFDSIDDSGSVYALSIEKNNDKGINSDRFVEINKKLMIVMNGLRESLDPAIFIWEHRNA